MKKLLLIAFGILTICSCSKDWNVQENLLNYSESVFGVKFNQNQDWNTTTNGFIQAKANADVKNIQVLASFVNPDSSISIKLLNQSSNGTYINYDVPDNYQDLFVAFINEKGEAIYNKFNILDVDVYESTATNSALTRSLSQDYVLPTEVPVINGTVESFANKRNWISGEVFYTFNNPSINSADYLPDFKTVFRTIIFNYFPNGRKYNNLPQIKKSGYYNESAYPITTGNAPIIVSPVYKNDGGYHEISEAELYYYYYKQDDLSREEIEALPKYKAIQLDEIYSNNDNDLIAKTKSYALVYWGENTPSVGTTGSYQFPKGYKVGFMYKSNTTTDNRKKQGELYCDGRLNYNINNWGNFKSSKLDSTEPRMAWMSINKKMFLCVESGTDADFNDLIVEVEGGIEPIEIIPDEPEYNFYTFCYEDHNLGDYDMNDVVLKGRRLNSTQVEYTLMATGAYDALYIYNINGNSIKETSEVHSLFNVSQNTFVNTLQGNNIKYIVDTITVAKTFSFLDASIQPYIYNKSQNTVIKIARKGQDPHAIMIPYDFRWPLERICIKDAYLQFNSWGMSLVEDTDWYLYPEDNKVK